VFVPCIKLFAHLRKLAGIKELQVSGEDLNAVLNYLVDQIPALDGVIMKNGQIRSHFVVIINGDIVTNLDASLSKDDVVAVFLPLVGG
jgi:molybdopterin converting factor small subunit